jgi:hypothetical protein
VPRRAGKTIGAWATVLGLLIDRPGYIVHFTAQSGLKARRRWQDIATILETDRGTAALARHGVTVKVVRSQGSEAFLFSNGSALYVFPPKGDSFRGEESDLWWGDEAQEFDPEQSLDLDGAVASTQDTRPDALMLLTGTPGEERSGLLWQYLEAGRAGRDGILEFGAGPDLDGDDPETWFTAHPGLAYGMTTLERIADHHAKIATADDPDAQRISFGREYLGRWPIVDGTALIDPEAWQALGSLEFDPRPDKGTGVVFALDCDNHQRWASIVAVWAVEELAAVEVIAQRPGVDWVSRELFTLARKYPDARLAWDGMPANIAATQPLDRARPAVRSQALGFRDLKDAAASILLAIDAERLRHYHQEGLDSAASSAQARTVGDGFLFQRSGPDVTPLVAASVGLWVLDRQKIRRKTRMRSASPQSA